MKSCRINCRSDPLISTMSDKDKVTLSSTTWGTAITTTCNWRLHYQGTWFLRHLPLSLHHRTVRLESLRDTLKPDIYFHPQSRHCCDHCDICQQEKLLVPGYGLRTECELLHTEQVELNALTCVNTTTNLVELTRSDNNEMTKLRDKFTQACLCRYPLQLGSTGAFTFTRYNMFVNIPLIVDWHLITTNRERSSWITITALER